MLNVKTGVFVDVLSQADLVTCGIDPSGRKLGPSSLYSYRHPAKKNVPKNWAISYRFRDATTRVKAGFQKAT